MALKYIAKQYQTYTTQAIIDNPEVGAFLDMGLGKTVATLTAIVELFKRGEIKKVLVIAPKKVAEVVWSDEIEKWEHLHGLTESKVLGNPKKREKALSAKAHIYTTNRENVEWLVTYYGSNFPFDMVVIDELSSFKNPKSIRFKSLRMVRKYIKRVVGLTGTPAPNGLLDLWSQLFLIDQGKSLGEKFTKYRETYFNAGSRHGHIVFNYTLKQGDALLGKEFYKQEIYHRIAKTCFSMKSEDYLSLPDRNDVTRWVKLSTETEMRYKEFEREKVLEFIEINKEITTPNAAGLTSKLLQFANGAIYDDEKNYHIVHDEKIESLEEIVEELNGKPLLLFYQFRHDLDRIQRKFGKWCRFLQTPQDIKDWNAKKLRIMITHTASAGHGLNLQFGGRDLLHYGLGWGLEYYEQGYKRVHRLGVEDIVTNLALLAKATMDEKVLLSLTGKADVQNGVKDAVKADTAKKQAVKELIKKYAGIEF